MASSLRGRLAGGGLADSSATHAPPGRRVESIRESAYLWVAVPTLARGDVERVLRFAGEAESLDGDDPFTEDLLVELGELVQADWITYFERDHLGRHLFEVGRPDEAEAWDGVPVEGWSDATLNGSPLTPTAGTGTSERCEFRTSSASASFTERVSTRSDSAPSVSSTPWK